MTFIAKHYNEEAQFNGETKEEVVNKILTAYNFTVEEYDGELKEFNGATYTSEKVAELEAGVAEAEKNRVKNLNCTKREFMLALYNILGIDFYATVYPLIETNTIARIEWEGCERIYRGNALLDSIGTQLGITSEQLDNLFKQIKGEIATEEFNNI